MTFLDIKFSFEIPIIRPPYIYLNKYVRIRGYFSKSKKGERVKTSL